MLLTVVGMSDAHVTADSGQARIRVGSEGITFGIKKLLLDNTSTSFISYMCNIVYTFNRLLLKVNKKLVGTENTY